MHAILHGHNGLLHRLGQESDSKGTMRTRSLDLAILEVVTYILLAVNHGSL